MTRYPGAVVTRYGGKSWIDRDIRQRPEAKSTFTSSGHTRQDTQYSAARAQILRYLHTPEHVYPGNSSQRSGEICRKIGSLKCWGGGESDFHWILASSLHRLSAVLGQIQRSVFIPFHCLQELILSSLKRDWITQNFRCYKTLFGRWLTEMLSSRQVRWQFWLLSAFIVGLLTSNL